MLEAPFLKTARFGLDDGEAEEDEVGRLVRERPQPIHLFARVRVPQRQVQQLPLQSNPERAGEARKQGAVGLHAKPLTPR